MKNLVRTTVVVTGILLFAGPTAAAAQAPTDDPQPEVGADVATPVLICPIGISLGGDVTTDCPPPAMPATPAAPVTPAPLVPGEDVADEVAAEVDAPVNVCPVGIALGGDVTTDCPPPVTLEDIITALFPPAVPVVPEDDAPEVGADIDAPVHVCPITVALGGVPDPECPT